MDTEQKDNLNNCIWSTEPEKVVDATAWPENQRIHQEGAECMHTQEIKKRNDGDLSNEADDTQTDNTKQPESSDSFDSCFSSSSSCEIDPNKESRSIETEAVPENIVERQDAVTDHSEMTNDEDEKKQTKKVEQRLSDDSSSKNITEDTNKEAVDDNRDQENSVCEITKLSNEENQDTESEQRISDNLNNCLSEKSVENKNAEISNDNQEKEDAVCETSALTPEEEQKNSNQVDNSSETIENVDINQAKEDIVCNMTESTGKEEQIEETQQENSCSINDTSENTTESVNIKDPDDKQEKEDTTCEMTESNSKNMQVEETEQENSNGLNSSSENIEDRNIQDANDKQEKACTNDKEDANDKQEKEDFNDNQKNEDASCEMMDFESTSKETQMQVEETEQENSNNLNSSENIEDTNIQAANDKQEKESAYDKQEKEDASCEMMDSESTSKETQMQVEEIAQETSNNLNCSPENIQTTNDKQEIENADNKLEEDVNDKQEKESASCEMTGSESTSKETQMQIEETEQDNSNNLNSSPENIEDRNIPVANNMQEKDDTNDKHEKKDTNDKQKTEDASCELANSESTSKETQMQVEETGLDSSNNLNNSLENIEDRNIQAGNDKQEKEDNDKQKKEDASCEITDSESSSKEAASCEMIESESPSKETQMQVEETELENSNNLNISPENIEDRNIQAANDKQEKENANNQQEKEDTSCEITDSESSSKEAASCEMMESESTSKETQMQVEEREQENSNNLNRSSENIEEGNIQVANDKQEKESANNKQGKEDTDDKQEKGDTNDKQEKEDINDKQEKENANCEMAESQSASKETQMQVEEMEQEDSNNLNSSPENIEDSNIQAVNDKQEKENANNEQEKEDTNDKHEKEDTNDKQKKEDASCEMMDPESSSKETQMQVEETEPENSNNLNNSTKNTSTEIANIGDTDNKQEKEDVICEMPKSTNREKQVEETEPGSSSNLNNSSENMIESINVEDADNKQAKEDTTCEIVESTSKEKQVEEIEKENNTRSTNIESSDDKQEKETAICENTEVINETKHDEKAEQKDSNNSTVENITESIDVDDDDDDDCIILNTEKETVCITIDDADDDEDGDCVIVNPTDDEAQQTKVNEVNSSITDNSSVNQVTNENKQPEEAEKNQVNEGRLKVHWTVQAAIRDLCKKILGREDNMGLSVEEIEKLNSDTNTTDNSHPQYKESLEMQRIVEAAIRGSFTRTYKSRAVTTPDNIFSSDSLLGDTSNDNLNAQDKATGRIFIQRIAETVLSKVPRQTIRDIMEEVKTLKCNEHLLLRVKLSLQCYETDACPGQSGSKAETKWSKSKCSQIEKIIEGAISEDSKQVVGSILKKAIALTPAEYLFLHFNFPRIPNYEHCREIPVQCGPIINQSIMWLKTHLEKCPNEVIPKQFVYKSYTDYFQRHQIKALGISDFGKLVRKVLPDVKQRRLLIDGKSRYCYGEYKYRYHLIKPRLPKLSNALEVEEDHMYTCHKCCIIYRNMHRKNIPTSTKEQPVSEPIPTSSSSNTFTAFAISDRDDDDDDDDDGVYKSDIVDGRKILVHDPLELLSVSVKDKKSSHPSKPPAVYERAPKISKYENVSSSYNKAAENSSDSRIKVKWSVKAPKSGSENIDGNSKTAESSIQLTDNSEIKYSAKSQAPKVKYKQYRHPSVKNVFKKYENIILPYEIYKLNVSPNVRVNNSDMHNWCAIHLNSFMQKLSKLVITKVDNTFKVMSICCKDISEVDQQQAEQLIDLKEKLSTMTVTKINNSSHYNVTCTLFEELPDVDLNQLSNNSFHINKKLNTESQSDASKLCQTPLLANVVHKLKNKHPSVQNIFKKYNNIVLPEEVFKSDMAPAIVLDSAEVCEWYEKRLNYLKRKLQDVPVKKVVHSYEIKSADTSSRISRYSAGPSRLSRAKMMNFCEMDSSDSEAEIPLLNLQSAVNKTETLVPSARNDETMPKTHTNDLVNLQGSSSITQKYVQKPEQYLKRPISEVNETNENVLKKKRFVCSKLTINNPENPVILEEKQIAYNAVEIRPPGQPVVKDKSENICFFCIKECRNKRELAEHVKIHLRCRTCKKRLKSTELMRQHLFRHCVMNNIKNKPYLQLYRVDSLKQIKYFPQNTKSNYEVPQRIENVTRPLLFRGNSKTYLNLRRQLNTPSNFCPSIEQVVLPMAPADLLNETDESNTLEINSSMNRPNQQRPNTYLRRVNQPSTPQVIQNEMIDENNESNIYQQIPEVEPVHLKNTISSNFSKILLLSNNVAPPHMQTPVFYGVYLNDSNEQSSPTVCLSNTNNSYNTDCAVNVNPSCSNSESTTTFMQIVEPPNPTLFDYTSPNISENSTIFETHQDHCYHQKEPVFSSDNHINSMDRMTMLNTVSQNPNFEMPYVSNVNTENPPPLTLLTNTNTNETQSTNPPPRLPGPFRIRVKDISELS